MNCPLDQKPLRPSQLDGLDMHGCEACEGAWVDHTTLFRLAFRAGRTPLEFKADPNAEGTPRSCPRCTSTLYAVSHPSLGSLHLSRCERCQGLWGTPAAFRHLVDQTQAPSSHIVGGRYLLGERVLQGRHTDLVRAQAIASGENVLLRRPRADVAAEPQEQREQTLREARYLSSLAHRNLPRVLETVEEGGQLWLVLEDCPGHTLDGFLQAQSEPLTEAELWRILEQLLALAGYLHGQTPPIVHRDLRPDTLLITPHGTLKVYDFGLATLRDPQVGHTLFRRAGSPIYASPEQLGGSSSRPCNDLYAVGAVMYYLASGAPPPPSLELYSGQQACQPLMALRQDLSRLYSEVVGMLMHPEASMRPASVLAVTEMMQILEQEYSQASLLEAFPAENLPLDDSILAAPPLTEPPLAVPEVPYADPTHAEVPSPDLPSPEHREEREETPPASSADTSFPSRTIPPAESAQPAFEATPTPEIAALAPTHPPTADSAPTELDPAVREAIENAPSPEPSTAAPQDSVEASPASPVPQPSAQAAASPAGGVLQARVERRSLWSKLFGGPAGTSVASAPISGPDETELERFPLLDLSTFELEREAGLLLPETVSRSIQGVCVGRRSDRELSIVVKDPTQVHIYDHVSFGTNGQYQPVLMRADDKLIELAQQYIYRLPQSTQGLAWLEWLERKQLEAETLDVKNVMEVTFGAEDITSPIIAAVDRIIKEAISSGASDIHLETFEAEMVVRYRIDGVLQEIATFAPREASAILKRIKILANLDIAQDRVTQGGRISVAVAGRELDLRVSIVPVPSGESAVLRLLKKGAFNLTLRDLGFCEADDERLRKVLSQPYGMVLVSGPTGSGKSTTLYASLTEIQRPDRKLLTIEDPIEYQMPRITQVQVNTAPREDEKKVTFARALREFLRQDPDVILVGEIRDAETAAISVQAALTGHMLLSTIHTNDSVGIVARLRDMGVEPYLISSVLLGGVAQRLCRRICRGCREEIPVPPAYRELLEAEGHTSPQLYHGKGCTTCHGTGYRGRMGLYEILEVAGDVRELIAGMARDEVIRDAARRNGFRTLYQDGLVKAIQGQVTLDEVQRVCMSI